VCKGVGFSSFLTFRILVSCDSGVGFQSPQEHNGSSGHPHCEHVRIPSCPRTRLITYSRPSNVLEEPQVLKSSAQYKGQLEFSSFSLFESLYFVMWWSVLNDHQRTMVLQTVARHEYRSHRSCYALGCSQIHASDVLEEPAGCCAIIC
jgi:hypothetical protein